jgi:hypothetical protein
MGHSVSSEPNFQRSDPRMKLSICEAKIMNSFGDFFKNWSFKNILNDLEVENLIKLVFRHIKLKLLTKTSISCLSHLCQLQLDLWVFSQLQVCEKLLISSFSQGYKWKTTTYKIMKICSFSYLPWYFKSTKYE